MLGSTYRFHVYNGTGVATDGAGTVTIKTKRWKMASDGSLSYEASEATPFSNAGAISNGSQESGTTQDNTTNKYFGGHFLASVAISTATPAGNIEIYLQESTDGGTTWGDNRTGELVATITFAATGTKKVDFEI